MKHIAQVSIVQPIFKILKNGTGFSIKWLATCRSSLAFCLLLIAYCLLPIRISAQNCSGFVVDNRTVGTTHYLRTATMQMVFRGDYSYDMEFFNNEKGVRARVTSKNGVEFNQGDELIFVDANNQRKTYRFIEMGDVVGRVYQNVLQLDVAAMTWFSEGGITTFYILSKATYEMRKFTMPDNRQAEFKALATCFLQTLDKSKVKNETINTESSGLKPSAPTASTPSVSNGGTGQIVFRKADIGPIDPEIGD